MSSPIKFAVGRCPCGQRALWAHVLWADVRTPSLTDKIFERLEFIECNKKTNGADFSSSVFIEL